MKNAARMKRISLFAVLLIFAAFATFTGCKKGDAGAASDGGDTSVGTTTAPTEMSAEAKEGQELYKKYACQTCHGDMGKGDGAAGAALNPKPRDFTKTAGYKQGSSIDEIALSIKNGVKGNPLMAPRADIPDEERKKIAAFIVALGGK